MFTSLALVTLALAPDVFVVDQSGAGDFTFIQQAVDAAEDGDVVLVRPGTYPRFQVFGAGISVIAETPGTVTVEGQVSIDLVQPPSQMTISGLTMRGSIDGTGAPRAALELLLCVGDVRIEDCVIQGAAGLDCLVDPSCVGGPAVQATFTVGAAFRGCSISGGVGGFSLAGGENNAGGHAVVGDASALSFYDSVLRGGDGHSSDPFSDDLDEGGDGGDALRAQGADSFYFLSGSSLVGGRGGDGDLCICLAGDGGDGLHLSGPGVRAALLDTALAGGSEGCGGPGSPFFGPFPGEPVRTESGASSSTVLGAARSLAGPNVLTAGNPATLDVRGEGGDVVFLLADPGGAPPAFQRVLHGYPITFQSRLPLPVAALPPSGVAQIPIGPGLLPPGAEGTTLTFQTLHMDTNGELWLSGPWTRVTLSASL